jgi:lysophospholipase L1-like esterase
MKRFERYVVIGDSTAEGLDDPDERGGYRGWADRLAERIAAVQGELLYANLAVRGKTTRQIREEQLEPALAMKPDLVVMSAGMNDMIRPRFDAAAYAGDVEAMQRPLIGQGATVMMFTLPDLRAIMPLARLFGDRTLRLNAAMRATCAATGAILCDLGKYPIGTDPRVWSDDRLHANALGHARVTEALAYHLGLPDTDMSWAEALPANRRTFGATLRAEWAWVRKHFLPWLWRHVRGSSSGDGITAKRPRLTPVGL